MSRPGVLRTLPWSCSWSTVFPLAGHRRGHRPGWLVPHYPPYWHYDVLQALLVLSRLGRVRDPRAGEALDMLIGLQQDDGLWHAGPSWWRAVGQDGTGGEVVDWGRRGPSEMITLNALRVLRAAGRLPSHGRSCGSHAGTARR